MAGGIHPNVLMQEELSSKELDGLDRDQTLFFIVVGPLEAHGPHLPVGADYFNAQAYALAAAREVCKRRPSVKVVISPTLPVGTYTCEFPGSVHVRQRVVRDLVADFGQSLAASGFRHVVVISPHHGPRHIVALEEACDIVNGSADTNMISPMGPIICKLFEGGYDEALAKSLGTSGDLHLGKDFHAGNWETSLLLLLRPELVDDGYRKLKPVLVDDGGARASALKALSEDGYLGSPAFASEELGKAALNLVAKELANTIIRSVEGELSLLESRTTFHSNIYYRTNVLRYATFAAVAILLLGYYLFFKLLS